MSRSTLRVLLGAALLAACGPAENATPDAGAPWPPSTPWWSETSCALPACSESDPTPIDASGTWTLSLTTKATDCNEAVRNLDPRLEVGHVHTGKPHALDVAGTCDYATDVTPRLHDGTFRGTTLVTCEVTQRLQQVTEVDTATLTFDDGHAAGTATAYFSNFPEFLEQPGNKCRADFDVMMMRAP
jgi:hypothetical protein